MKLFANTALTEDGWAKNVRVTLDNTGRIEKLESAIERNNDDQYLRNRILLPALSNLSTKTGHMIYHITNLYFNKIDLNQINKKTKV